MATVTKFAPIAQPDHATIHWLGQCYSRGRVGVFSERAVLGPDVARALLDANNHNRNVSEARVRQYTRDMINGLWVFNGEPIIVADTGELNDGQHRLHAVIASNRPIETIITFGVPRESRVTLDQGGARTSGHYLGMAGVKNANLCASVARLVIGFEDSAGTRVRSETSNGEVVARVHRDSGIGVSASFASGVHRYAKGLVTATFIGGAHYLFSRINQEQAEQFLTQVCVGENIKRGDPAFAVRQALADYSSAGTHSARLGAMEIIFIGWNSFRQRRTLRGIGKPNNNLPALI